VPLFEVGPPELEFDGSELPLHNPDQEVPTSAGRLQKAGVNALSLALDEVEHCFDHPRRSEHLPMVGNPLLGFDQAHESRIRKLAGRRAYLSTILPRRDMLVTRIRPTVQYLLTLCNAGIAINRCNSA
jgi:hypothetical protein